MSLVLPSPPGTSDKEAHPRQPSSVVLVCSADEGFAKPLAVTLFSALSNYRGTLPVDVYIINGGIGGANRLRVNRMLARLGAHAQWIEPDWRPVQHLAVSERYPTSTYLRLLIPRLLPDRLEKAIYLDSDLLVLGDIAELWSTSLGGKALLAAQDRGVPTVGSRWGLENCEELGLERTAMYFNSGVLVFDLTAWRGRALAERVTEYIAAHAHQTTMGEQHAMNAVLSREWAALEQKWNQQVWAWETTDASEYQLGVLHFVYTSKPWEPAGVHWTNFLYDRYLKRSGWYSTFGWWRYYAPLLLRRQQVLHMRSRQRHSARHAPDAGINTAVSASERVSL